MTCFITKMVESNMKTNVEKANSIVSGQRQPLTYLIGFEQESRSHLGNLESLQPLEGLGKQNEWPLLAFMF